MTNLHTSTYRGVGFRHLSITQVEVIWGEEVFLAEGHMDAMRMVDDLLASIEMEG
jgi:hypothetical protein